MVIKILITILCVGTIGTPLLDVLIDFISGKRHLSISLVEPDSKELFKDIVYIISLLFFGVVSLILIWSI